MPIRPCGDNSANKYRKGITFLSCDLMRLCLEVNLYPELTLLRISGYKQIITKKQKIIRSKQNVFGCWCFSFDHNVPKNKQKKERKLLSFRLFLSDYFVISSWSGVNRFCCFGWSGNFVKWNGFVFVLKIAYCIIFRHLLKFFVE